MKEISYRWELKQRDKLKKFYNKRKEKKWQATSKNSREAYSVKVTQKSQRTL